MSVQATPLFTPNATQRLSVVPYYLRNDEPLHPIRTLALRPDDHQLLSLLTASVSGDDLLLRDSDLVLRRCGDRSYLEEGAVLFSPDRRQMTSHTHQVHRRGRAVLFPNKSRFPLGECWTLMLNPQITYVRNTFRRRPVQPVTTEIARPDRPCSVCLEDLNGDLATCPNRHQIHRQCYEGMNPHRRACPECRTQYPPDEAVRLADTPDRTLLHRRIVFPNETRRNADLRFAGLLRRIVNHGDLWTMAMLDTLDYWVRRPKQDYLLGEEDDTGTPCFIDTDRPAWRDFMTYLTSQENLDRLKERDLSPSTYNASYDEARFLADLLVTYPQNAQERLARATTDAERMRLRRECWVQHRFVGRDYLRDIVTYVTKLVTEPNNYQAIRVQMTETFVET